MIAISKFGLSQRRTEEGALLQVARPSSVSRWSKLCCFEGGRWWCLHTREVGSENRKWGQVSCKRGGGRREETRREREPLQALQRRGAERDEWG